MPRRFTFVVYSLVLHVIILLATANATKCPQETRDWITTTQAEHQVPASLEIVNQSPLPITIYWVDSEGNNSDKFRWGPVAVGNSERISTYTHHHFRIYGNAANNKNDDILLLEHTVKETEDRVQVLGNCDEVAAMARKLLHDTDKEMRSLVHDQQAPCLPAHDSSQWSCIRHISKQDYEERLDKHGGTLYGFNSTEEAGERKIGATVDLVHQGAIPSIPRVANGPGYLKMSFTDRMKQVLLPFFEEHKRGGIKDSELTHRTIPGGFTNSHVVLMSIIGLDRFPEIHNEVTNELQRILQWWTNQTLVPTSTFGIRNYHRGSMLINHVDRADTHIASAVIQVAQEGVDEGWPLEVLHPDGSCDEVYLQPGELVLYEGARFQHGRPMRFNGTGFANIFSHFRPVDWHGPGNSPNYDGKLDQDGFLMSNGDLADSSDEL